MNKIKFIVRDFFFCLGVWLIGIAAREIMGEVMERAGKGIQDYERGKNRS